MIIEIEKGIVFLVASVAVILLQAFFAPETLPVWWVWWLVIKYCEWYGVIE